MNGAFYVGAAGLHSQQRALEIVANNIANMNTPGFKRSEVRFSELVSADTSATGPNDFSSGVEGLGGVMSKGSSPVFLQGDLKVTGNNADIAISGEGFFELVSAQGDGVLWRGGAIKVNADGFLASANGMPFKAMISVPAEATEVKIDPNGAVSAIVGGAIGPQDLGRLDMVRVRDIAAMTSLGDGLYQPANPGDVDEVAPGEDGAGLVVQGSLEGSNVQLSDEMVTMLLMQRAYAANAQVVQAGDQLMAIANGLRR